MTRNQLVLAIFIIAGILFTAPVVFENYRLGASREVTMWSAVTLLFQILAGVWLIIWVWQTRQRRNGSAEAPLLGEPVGWEGRAAMVALVLILFSFLNNDLSFIRIPLASITVIFVLLYVLRYRREH